MTDRIKGFVVTLAHDIREDDAQATVNAIRQIKGVLDVVPQIAGPDDAIVAIRTKTEIAQKLSGMALELMTS